MICCCKTESSLNYFLYFLFAELANFVFCENAKTNIGIQKVLCKKILLINSISAQDAPLPVGYRKKRGRARN